MATNVIKPNFLCIGAQKSGTTWLYYNLKEHPQIWLPLYKEIHYFDEIYVNQSLAKSTITRRERGSGVQVVIFAVRLLTVKGVYL